MGVFYDMNKVTVGDVGGATAGALQLGCCSAWSVLQQTQQGVHAATLFSGLFTNMRGLGLIASGGTRSHRAVEGNQAQQGLLLVQTMLATICINTATMLCAVLPRLLLRHLAMQRSCLWRIIPVMHGTPSFCL
jgi:hypothetical protein